MGIDFNRDDIFSKTNTEIKRDDNRNRKMEMIEFKIESPKYELGEIILSDKNLEEIKTVVNAQKNWDKVFKDWGLGEVLKQRNNLFINLYGAPGTGKTMAAHAIAKELGKKMICVNYADIESKYVGETNKNLVKLFDYAKEEGVIIFFDEADALLSKRVTDMSSSTDVSVNQTRSQLLTILNDYSEMVIFATNFITNFDVAFMRRIQFHVKFDLPNMQMRERLWKLYMPSRMPVEVNVAELSEKYDGISGSDISTAVLKAALKAANNGEEKVLQNYFEEAIQSIIESKRENSSYTVTTRKISEEEALKNINVQ